MEGADLRTPFAGPGFGAVQMASVCIQAGRGELPTDPRMSEFKCTLNGFTAIVGVA